MKGADCICMQSPASPGIKTTVSSLSPYTSQLAPDSLYMVETLTSYSSAFQVLDFVHKFVLLPLQQLGYEFSGGKFHLIWP